VGSPLAKLLNFYTPLSHDEQLAVSRLGRNALREVGPRRDVIREGARPGTMRLIVEGWACRFKTLPDGRRQTLGFSIPGDLCDPNLFMLEKMDHSIGAITPLTYAEIGRSELEALTYLHPRVGEALARSELVRAAIQREWVLNIGQRCAREHLANLIAELVHRLAAIGRVRGTSCEFPLTQADLADATGLTPVHVNRVMKELRGDGVIELEHRRLIIPDLARLEKIGLFNPTYLHEHESVRIVEPAAQALLDEYKALKDRAESTADQPHATIIS
jgi:CRP-like cAMP-binding protein